MAFGQQSGPPASARQVAQLLDLLQEAGHDGFRDARGAMGFTQRQAGGKFTRDEADALIEQLENAAHDAGSEAPTAPASKVPVPKLPAPTSAASKPTKAERALRDVPDGQLAAELQRRGWIVVEP